MVEQKVNLLNYNYQQMRDLFIKWDEKPFRAQQLIQWVHQSGSTDFTQMTNLGKALREKLSRLSCISLPEIVTSRKSSDGTHKSD